MRSGSAAASAALSAAPSKTPSRTARSDPAAFITARMSSIRSSSGRFAGDRVGEAGAALVEHDQARERREAAEEPPERRVFPVPLDMGEEARHVDQIHGPVADDLVGDVDAAAARVARLWKRAGHSRSSGLRSHSETCAGCIVSWTTAPRSVPSASRSTSSLSRAEKASSVAAAS